MLEFSDSTMMDADESLASIGQTELTLDEFLAWAAKDDTFFTVIGSRYAEESTLAEREHWVRSLSETLKLDRHPSAESGLTANEWFDVLETKLAKMREGRVIPQLEVHFEGPVCKDAVDFMSRVLLDGRYLDRGDRTAAKIAEELDLVVRQELLDELDGRDWSELRKEALERMTELYVDQKAADVVSSPRADIGATVAVAIGGTVVIGIGVTIYYIATAKNTESFGAIDDSPGAESKL